MGRRLRSASCGSPGRPGAGSGEDGVRLVTPDAPAAAALGASSNGSPGAPPTNPDVIMQLAEQLRIACVSASPEVWRRAMQHAFASPPVPAATASSEEGSPPLPIRRLPGTHPHGVLHESGGRGAEDVALSDGDAASETDSVGSQRVRREQAEPAEPAEQEEEEEEEALAASWDGQTNPLLTRYPGDGGYDPGNLEAAGYTSQSAFESSDSEGDDGSGEPLVVRQELGGRGSKKGSLALTDGLCLPCEACDLGGQAEGCIALDMVEQSWWATEVRKQRKRLQKNRDVHADHACARHPLYAGGHFLGGVD